MKDKDWEEKVKTEVRKSGIQAVRDAIDTTTVPDYAETLRKAAGQYAAQPLDINWILTPSPFPMRRRVLITPVQAAEILDRTNRRNRPVRQARMRKLIARVRQSGWVYMHQGIAFDTDGVLIDGQLRLMVSRDEGITMDVDATIGLPSDVFYDVDTGDSRSPRENLEINDEKYSTVLQSAIHLIYWYKTDRLSMRNRFSRPFLSNRMYLTLMEEYGDLLRACAKDAYALYLNKQSPRIPPGPVTAALYLIREKVDDVHYVEDFLHGIRTGADLSEGDARNPFRNYWYNINNKIRTRPSIEEAFGSFLKCWNQWGGQEYVSLFKFSGIEKVPEVKLPFTVQ